MVLYLLYIGTVYQAFSSITSSDVTLLKAITARSFRLVDEPALGPKRLSPSSTSHSVVSCASSCMATYDTCWSFMYNSSTGLCTPGSSFDSQQQLPTQDEGNLYNSLQCTSRGFQMYRRNNTTACVAEFMAGTYFSGGANCRSYGGVLMSVRTYAKMGILMEASGSGNSWVGCDDLDNDGVFTWKEDNGVLTENEITTLFVSTPTSQCIHYDKVYRQLNSNNCSLTMNFFCEIPLP